MGQSQRCTSAAVTLQPGMLLSSSVTSPVFPVTQCMAEGERWREGQRLEQALEERGRSGIPMLLPSPLGLRF